MMELLTFTVEETELAACFLPAGNRMALIKNIVHAEGRMEKEVLAIAKQTVRKLAQMPDEAYSDRMFQVAGEEDIWLM